MKQSRKKASFPNAPKEKQERREKAKKRYLTVFSIAMIWALLISGFYLILGRNGRNEPPQTPPLTMYYTPI